MGTVLRGRDPELDRPVAIKLLHGHRSLDEEHRARLFREAQALAALAHPNIVNVFEVGVHEGHAFVAMELVEGLPLHTWTREREGAFTEVVRMYVQAGRGLHAAHVRGLVHRDFKPSNVLVGNDGRARVLDFGLATLDGGAEASRSSTGSGQPSLDALSGDLTADGAVVGTPAYMAPEQHTREPVTAATDQFGFCVALWEALAGQRPYLGNDLASVRASIVRGTIAPVPAGVQVPRRILRLLARGLSIRPEERWPSLAVLCDRLEAALRPPRRWPWALAAAGASAALAIVLLPGPRSPCAAEAQVPLSPADRDALARAFEDGGVPEAAAAWPAVAQSLDEHTTAWIEAYARACGSTVTDAEAQRAFDLQMGCLQQQRDSLRAVVDVLAHGEPSSLVHGPDAVAQLRPVSACLEAVAGDPATARPEEPGQAKLASELRARMVAADALVASGRLDEAEAEARAVLDGATGLGFAPVRVEAELSLGIVLSRRGRPAEAEPLLARAYWGASDLDYAKVGAEVALELAWQVGYLQGRHAEGIEWARHYESVARRIGRDPARHVAQVLGPIHFDAEQFEQARPYLERQLADALAREADDPYGAAVARMNFANLLLELDEDERAGQEYRLAQEALERQFPQGHPDLALAMINRAELELERDLPQAEALLARGLAMSRALNGELHPSTGLGYAKLGALHLKRAEPAKAVEALEKAVRAYAGAAPGERLLAEHGLAEALRTAGRAQQAEARWRAVLVAAETELGRENDLVLYAQLGLGQLAQDRGALEVARKTYEAARAKASPGSEIREALDRALAGLPTQVASKPPTPAG